MNTPNVVKEALGFRLGKLEEHLNADVAFYYGPIDFPLILSPGTSKPATYGRIKTSQ